MEKKNVQITTETTHGKEENQLINNKYDTKNNNDKLKSNIKKITIDLRLRELENKDKIIECLKKEIEILKKQAEEDQSYFNKEISNLKENNRKKINVFKNYLGNGFNFLREEISKIKIDKNGMKVKSKNEIKQKDFDSMKEDLKNLNEKYSKFEKVFDNKIDFIESSISKLLEINKKKEEQTKIENKINVIKINDNTKKFKNLLDIIFSEDIDINSEDLKQLEDISLKLIKEDIIPVEIFSEYFNEKYGQKKLDEYSEKLIYKKCHIFEILNNLESQNNIEINSDKKKNENLEEDKNELLYYFLNLNY